MKVTEQDLYRPITIVLETEDEAKELLGILQKVVLSGPNQDVQVAFQSLRNTLHNRLGFPMAGLYRGQLERY